MRVAVRLTCTECKQRKYDTVKIKQEIADLAKQYGMKEDAVEKALSKDMLSHDIKIKKAVDLVADSEIGRASCRERV